MVERVSKIAKGSKADADMSINYTKTEVLHVQNQIAVSPTTEQEAAKVCKFSCPHTGCSFKFLTKQGMLVHAGKCPWKNRT